MREPSGSLFIQDLSVRIALQLLVLCNDCFLDSIIRGYNYNVCFYNEPYLFLSLAMHLRQPALRQCGHYDEKCHAFLFWHKEQVGQ